MYTRRQLLNWCGFCFSAGALVASGFAILMALLHNADRQLIIAIGVVFVLSLVVTIIEVLVVSMLRLPPPAEDPHAQQV